MRSVRFALLFLVTVCVSALAHAQLSPSATLYPAYGADAQDEFGRAIAMNASWLAVGAPWDYSLGNAQAGAVYLFSKQNDDWILEQRVTAPETAAGAGFGLAVAIHGNTLVVGEPLRTSGGVVHVFEYVNRTWTHAETLEAPSASPRQFGRDLDIEDTTLVIAAPAFIAPEQGHTYTYTKRSEGWTFAGALFSPSTSWRGPQRVAVSQGRIAVTSSTTEAVDVFEPQGGAWTHTVSLIASWNGEGFDLLGDRILIGGSDSNAAIVYEWTGTAWDATELALPTTPEGTPGLAALTPTRAFIALTATPPAANTVLEYLRTASGWSLIERVPIDPIGDVTLDGWTSIAAHGETVAVGWLEARLPETQAGAVSIFRPGNLARSRQPVVRLSNRETARAYGRAVSLDGPRIAITSETGTSLYVSRDGRFELEGDANSGKRVSLDGTRVLVGDPDSARASVSVLRPTGIYQVSEWVEEQEIGGPATFGTAVALSGTRLMIGIPGVASDTGYVAVYGFDGTSWIPQGDLRSPDPVAGDQFGASLDLDGARALIGAPGREHADGVYGMAYVFELANDAWQTEAVLQAPGLSHPGRFGATVALDGGRALVGAPGIASSGAAYVFDGTAWRHSSTLSAPDGDPSFGASLDLSGNRAVVGAPLGPPFEGPSSDGTAFVFGFDGRAWSFTDRMASEPRSGRMAFGSGVSIQGRAVIVGEPGNGTVGPTAGAAYLFEVPFAVGIDDALVTDASSPLGLPTPNPSTTATQVTLTLHAPDHVTVTVYDALGRAVGLPVEAAYGVGTHTLRLNDPSLPPGLYVVRVIGETVSASRAFTRVR